jgi:hypothetical protein
MTKPALWTLNDVQTLADEVKAFVVKAQSVVEFLETNKTAVNIENHIPHGDKIIAALGGTSKILGMVGQALPYVGVAFAAYETYKALGGRPMDANDIAIIDHDKTRDM